MAGAAVASTAAAVASETLPRRLLITPPSCCTRVSAPGAARTGPQCTGCRGRRRHLYGPFADVGGRRADQGLDRGPRPNDDGPPGGGPSHHAVGASELLGHDPEVLQDLLHERGVLRPVERSRLEAGVERVTHLGRDV